MNPHHLLRSPNRWRASAVPGSTKGGTVKPRVEAFSLPAPPKPPVETAPANQTDCVGVQANQQHLTGALAEHHCCVVAGRAVSLLLRGLRCEAADGFVRLRRRAGPRGRRCGLSKRARSLAGPL